MYKSLIFVCGRKSWEHSLPSLMGEAAQVVQVYHEDLSEGGAQELYEYLVGVSQKYIAFLSSHDTLERDLVIAERLRRETKKVIFSPASRQVDLALDKEKMLSFFHAGENFSVPAVRSLHELKAAIENENSAFVAKKRKGFCGEGFAIINDAQALEPWLIADQEDWLFQDFKKGREYSILTVCSNGTCTAFPEIDKDVTAVEHWQHPMWRTRFCPSVDMSPSLSERLQASVREIVAQLGASGIIEIEFIVDDAGQIWFVEFNPRVPATIILCAMVAERNFFEIFADYAMSKEVDISYVPPCGYGTEIILEKEDLPQLEAKIDGPEDICFAGRFDKVSATVWHPDKPVEAFP